jgi:hypothetical protein
LRDGRQRGKDIFDLRPQELRRCTERITILAQRVFVFLERDFLLVVFSELTAV